MMLLNFILLSLMTFQSIQESMGTVVVEILMQSYTYQYTKSVLNGETCEKDKITGAEVACSPIFHACLNQYEHKGSLRCSSHVFKFGPYYRRSSINFDSESLPNNVQNPLQFIIENYTSDTTLLVYTQQYQSDMILTFTNDKLLSVRDNHPAANQSVAAWFNEIFYGVKTVLILKFSSRVYCAPNYYGNECDIYIPHTNDSSECLPAQNCTIKLTADFSTNVAVLETTHLSSSVASNQTNTQLVTLPTTIDPSKIPNKALALEGKLDAVSFSSLIKVLRQILINQMKINSTKLLFNAEKQLRNSISGFTVTVIVITASYNGQPLTTKEINSYLFRYGKSWLDEKISHNVYIGKLRHEESSEDMEESIKIAIVVVCALVGLLVLIIILTFMYNSHIKRQRIRHARIVFPLSGVQFTRSSTSSSNVNIMDNNDTKQPAVQQLSYDQAYSSASEYDYLSIQKKGDRIITNEIA